MADAIVVQGLGKRYRRRSLDHPTTLKETLLGGIRGSKRAECFWALRDVSFGIAPGRMVGVVGANGAGKSTLLRLIGGVGRPDEGSIQVEGRIGALLDLGVGFHPDLTGRENALLNGVISGLTRQEAARRLDSIVAFAELEEFIDSPLHTYSTGMEMRLGFSVAVHTGPEILLIDEILAVGDIAFQRKCIDRIAQFKAEGCTILLVSHDTKAIQDFCDEALWFRRGELVLHGPADVVTGQYVAEMSAETRRRTPPTQVVRRTGTGVELRINENRFGSLEMEIITVKLYNAGNQLTTELDSGAALWIEIEYLAPQPIQAPIFGISISLEDGTQCYDTSTEGKGIRTPVVEGTGCITLQLERLDLSGGQYFVDVGVYQHEWAYAYDYHWHAYPLTIRPTRGERGILHPPTRWAFGAASPVSQNMLDKPTE